MEIIAEIGQNHNGDMRLAQEMIRLAKKSGADAVKFQVFEARKLFTSKNNPWFRYNCRTELSRDQVEFLVNQCRINRIEFLASVFDAERVDWLEEVEVRRYKVASRSIYNTKLVKRLCLTGKPLIVSLGKWKKKSLPGFKTSAPVEFLYCVSNYPASIRELKLNTIDFRKYSGFSDHSVGVGASMFALMRGARIIEKHFTLEKSAYGPDHALSMNPEELLLLSQFRDELKKLRN